MFILGSTTRSLELTFTTAINSNDIAVQVSVMDIRGDGARGAQTILTNVSSSGTTIAAAPGPGITRFIETINICNNDDVSHEVEVIYREGSTTYTIVKITLTAGDTLIYEDG